MSYDDDFALALSIQQNDEVRTYIFDAFRFDDNFNSL